MDPHEFTSLFGDCFGDETPDCIKNLVEELYEAGIDPDLLTMQEFDPSLLDLPETLEASDAFDAADASESLDLPSDAGGSASAEQHATHGAEPRFGAGRCASCSGTGTWWTPGSGTRPCPNCGGSGVG